MLDELIRVLHEIDKEIETTPQKVTEAPHSTPVSRIDEVLAARQLNLRYREARSSKLEAGSEGAGHQKQPLPASGF